MSFFPPLAASVAHRTRIALTMVMLAFSATNAAEPEPEPESTEKKALPPSKPLDLRAPDITKIFSAEELDQILSKTVDPNLEEVEVEGARNQDPPPPSTPVVWPSIFAPFWAILHPTQAWRIIAPLPPDQANRVGNETFDATDPYRPPPPLPR